MKAVHRLKNGKQIGKILSSNNKIYSSSCILCYLFTKKNDPYHISIVVSKKISKKAVIRNKIKRQIRAIIDSLNLNLYGIDIVIITKSTWLTLNYIQNKQNLNKMFLKLNKGGDFKNGK